MTVVLEHAVMNAAKVKPTIIFFTLFSFARAGN